MGFFFLWLYHSIPLCLCTTFLIYLHYILLYGYTIRNSVCKLCLFSHWVVDLVPIFNISLHKCKYRESKRLSLLCTALAEHKNDCARWPCKAILIINEENQNCLIGFKVFCQNIPSSPTVLYKCKQMKKN